MNNQRTYLIFACLCSTLALSLNASQASSRSASSSSSVASLSSSSATTTASRSINSSQQAIAQNTLGGISLNPQVLDKITDRVTQKLTQALTAAGKGIAADLNNELNAAITKGLAEAKKTGNEVFVRGGEILLSSGLRLTFICVIVGATVFLLLNHPYLAASLITIFLSAPALYLHSKGELRPLLLDVMNAYGNTARLQHTLETTTQILEATNSTLAETRAALEATRTTLAEATAKLNVSHQ